MEQVAAAVLEELAEAARVVSLRPCSQLKVSARLLEWLIEKILPDNGVGADHKWTLKWCMRRGSYRKRFKSSVRALSVIRTTAAAICGK